tara:strand:- start:580 stop:906 length:327 start_codon:yes stop_codon:yes gene_type:complete
MQTFIVQWQFPTQEASIAATKTFTDYVKDGSPYDDVEGFKVLNRVVNPHEGNGMAIVEASNHAKIWKWCQPWVSGFGNEVQVTPVLTDEEFVAVTEEIETTHDNEVAA